MNYDLTLMKRWYCISALCLLAVAAMAGDLKWQTHFSYNNVEQIALYSDEVYALANGKIFSVNQATEQLTMYNNQSGLHGTEIAQVVADSARNQLLIIYLDGKVDVLYNGTMHYVSDLYSKKMTSSKRCNNVTIAGDLAYLSMDFGILTFDLNRHEFPNTFYIGAEASEVIVQDVLLSGDSIHAKTAAGVYSASLADNIVDFRYWKLTNAKHLTFDTKKGKEYVDKWGGVWKAAGEKGVTCKFVTGVEHNYLPQGPIVNTPYSMCCNAGRLYVVPGGRWFNQDLKQGHVMIYDNDDWVNITNSYIQGKTGKKALDFVSVAVDPNDSEHFYVASYGTGLYEFYSDTLVNRYTPHNSILGSAAPTSPDTYTRVDNLAFDADGRLWCVVAGGIDTSLVAFMPNNTQRGVNLYTEIGKFSLNTPGGLVIDRMQPNRKWLLACRKDPALALLDDAGTPFDMSDDVSKVQSQFYDQDAQVIAPEFFYTMAQAPNGDIWVGSSVGPIILPHETDFIETTSCERMRITMPDGSNFLDLERVNAFEWDDKGYVWIGTQTSGVFVVDAEKQKILSCYTSDNTVMPSNMVMSLAFDDLSKKMYIGTSMGLVSVDLSDDSNTATDEPIEEEETYGSMYQWRSHAAFTSMDELVVLGDEVYTRSGQSLFSVEKESGLINYHTRLTGLNGSRIDHIAHNTALNKLLITYQDGQLDILDAAGDVQNISDLYLKQMSLSKVVNDICMYQNKAYLAMSFGVLVIDMQKLEIEDTYYIGMNSTEVNVEYITISNGKIYAASQTGLYVADLTDNLVDYNFWIKQSLPGSKALQSMRAHNNKVYLVRNKVLYSLQDNQWQTFSTEYPVRRLEKTENHLYIMPENVYGVLEMQDDGKVTMTHTYGYVNDVVEDGNTLWFATRDDGVVKYANELHSPYFPDGPSSNYSYRLRFFGDKLYMLPGGRWANQYKRLGEVMMYENGEWNNIKNGTLVENAGMPIYDIMNVAQDPQDANHYFLTTYGTGVLEMRADSLVNLYLPHNSTLKSAVSSNPENYTRTDGAIYDEQGNLWLLNMGITDGNIQILSPDGKWSAFDVVNSAGPVTLHTAGEIMIDRRNPQWKWIPLLRYNTGLILLQDNGTPSNPSDDKVTYRKEWMDQKGHLIAPEQIHSLAQDHNNTIWVGTSKGLFIIPSTVDYATSNACERIIIPRNDGTGLGDYLLDNEQVNAIAIDGANRIWIGTATSGIYLMGFTESTLDVDYTLETIAHFTTENSLLPSDDILSIAIQESTGEVFIGTGSGLVSYMSDAIEPEDNFSSLYAYPNPVYPNYKGSVVIKGLMADTEVRIVDPAGNVVKTLMGNGGEVVWDITNTQGQRVASGVYTALCNTISGVGHGAVKILIIN